MWGLLRAATSAVFFALAVVNGGTCDRDRQLLHQLPVVMNSNSTTNSAPIQKLLYICEGDDVNTRIGQLSSSHGLSTVQELSVSKVINYRLDAHGLTAAYKVVFSLLPSSLQLAAGILYAR
jgi:hypothetical protein